MTPSNPRQATGLLMLAAMLSLFAAAPSHAAAPPRAFAACAGCHPVSPSGANGMGPNLFGVVGRKAGSAPGFRYSRALQGVGLTWSRSELDAYLANPSRKVPGNAMPDTPVSAPADRAAIISYLASLPGPRAIGAR